MYPTSEILLIALFVQAVLYGLYIASLVHCLRWLLYADDGWERRDGINKLMLFATILIFIISTVNLGIALRYEFFFLGAKNVWNVTAELMSVITGLTVILIVDAVLIHRCWTAYANSWRVVCLPTICWFGCLTCAVLNIYYDYVQITTTDPSRSKWGRARYLNAVIGFYAGDIATNLYSTSAIIYRILRVTNASANSPKRMRNTVRILAESGILYTSMAVFNLIGITLDADPKLTDSRVTVVSLVSDALNFSMAGITFNLVLIRINQDRIRLTDSYADTGDANQKTPSELRFRIPHSMTDCTVAGSQATCPQANEEEHHSEQGEHARGD